MSSFFFYYGITSVGVEKEELVPIPDEAMEPYLIGRVYGHLEVVILALESVPPHPSLLGPIATELGVKATYNDPITSALRDARIGREQLLKLCRMKGFID